MKLHREIQHFNMTFFFFFFFSVEGCMPASAGVKMLIQVRKTKKFFRESEKVRSAL